MTSDQDAQASELMPVSQVMASRQPLHLLKGLFATFCVEAHPHQIGWRGILYEGQVGVPKGRKAVEGRLEISPIVVQALSPGVLIKRRQRWAVFSEHESEVIGADELDIGQMGDHHPRRPFPWRLWPVELWHGDASEVCAEQVARFGQDLEGLLRP
jgi:hypothetical protein